MPKWIQHVSDFNPVNWGVVAGRGRHLEPPRLGAWVASRRGIPRGAAGGVPGACRDEQRFRSYQRSV